MQITYLTMVAVLEAELAYKNLVVRKGKAGLKILTPRSMKKTTFR